MFNVFYWSSVHAEDVIWLLYDLSAGYCLSLGCDLLKIGQGEVPNLGKGSSVEASLSHFVLIF